MWFSMFSLHQSDYLETTFLKLFPAVLVIQHSPRTGINPGLQWVSVRLMTLHVAADTLVGLLTPFIGNQGVSVKFLKVFFSCSWLCLKWADKVEGFLIQFICLQNEYNCWLIMHKILFCIWSLSSLLVGSQNLLKMSQIVPRGHFISCWSTASFGVIWGKYLTFQSNNLG